MTFSALSQRLNRLGTQILQNCSPQLRTKEGYLFIAGSIFATLVVIVSSICHYVVEPFNYMTHWVSSMGVGPNGSDVVMNGGLFITGILYLAMACVLTCRFQREAHSKGAKVVLILGILSAIISCVGIWLLTIWNMEANFVIHNIGAFMFFIGTPIFTSLMTTGFFIIGKGSKMQVIVSTILVLLFISLPIFMMIGAALENIAMDEVLGSMGPGLGLARLVEWMAVLGFFVWILQTGLHIVRNQPL